MALKIGSTSPNSSLKYLATKNGQPALYRSGTNTETYNGLSGKTLAVTYQAETNPYDIAVGEGIIAHAEGVENSATATGLNKLHLFNALQAAESNSNAEALITEIVCSDSNRMEFGNGHLGRSIAIHDGHVFVGAPHWPSNGERGKVFKFTTQGEETNQSAQLNSQGYFGSVVVAGCGKVAVSTGGRGIFENVWLYNTDFTNPITIQRPSQNSSLSQFGFDLAIGDDLLVIAHAGGSSPGTAYIYDLDGNYLRELQSPEASPQGNDDYGYSIAIGEGIIAVGAVGESGGGAVYIFDYNGKFIKKLSHEPEVLISPNIGDRFGENVSISGGRIYVSDSMAHLDNFADLGIISVFDIEGNFINHLSPVNPQSFKYYGRGMQVSNGFMVTRGLTDSRGEWDVRTVQNTKTPLSMKNKYMHGIE